MQQNYFISILQCVPVFFRGRELTKLILFYGFNNFNLKKNYSGLGVYEYEGMAMRCTLHVGQLRTHAIIGDREREVFLL